jgi:hypothetical protein
MVLKRLDRRHEIGAEGPARVKASKPPARSQSGTYSPAEQVLFQEHIINRHKGARPVAKVKSRLIDPSSDPGPPGRSGRCRPGGIITVSTSPCISLPERIALSQRRKRRTREHIIADLSVNYVERLVLRYGWVARRMNPDGIDLYMETYNDRGEIENGGVWFQLKATDRLIVIERMQAIPVRMEWRDLLFWLNERMPGILIIYDARQDRAWWLHSQTALRSIKRKDRERLASTVILHIPIRNRLDESDPTLRRTPRWRPGRERRSTAMRTSQVRFSQLRVFLEQLGFSECRDAHGWRFEHRPLKAVCLFRPYGPTDYVYQHDLFLVRSQLNCRGLITEEAFNESFTKTPA